MAEVKPGWYFIRPFADHDWWVSAEFDGEVWCGGWIEAAEVGPPVPLDEFGAPLPMPAPWFPTHRHRARGSLYRLLHRGFLETDLSAVTVYQGQDGRVWVRPASEFDDGRFEAIPRGAPVEFPLPSQEKTP